MRSDPRAFQYRLRETPLDDASGSGRRKLELILPELKTGPGEEVDLEGSLAQFLSGVFAGSSFLWGLAERNPTLLARMLIRPSEAEFADILSRCEVAAARARSIRDIMRVLRQAKSEAAFLIALADLAGIWPVEEATERLSKAADVFLGLAVRFLLDRAAEAGHFLPKDAANPEKESGLVILGMGKYGAQELNYSSDIDLIIFFDREMAPVTANVEASVFFVRLTRDLVHILQEWTPDGYVFRTDLRLRPDPGSTQAAISTEAAFRYYESLGQNWERAALIKARPVAGDISAGERFMKDLGPYIWRKYLDYNAILDIHAMKRQIHAAKGHAHIAVAGHNLKLGRGGIREIEFFVQSQQLIAGGRQPALRTRQTLSALNVLTDFGWIGPRVHDGLRDAYRFLRRMEHRLQMMADQQTHTLPAAPEELARFSRFAGYQTTDAFASELRGHMEKVEAHYAALFESVPELTPKRVKGNLVFTGDADDPGTSETLGKLGFKNPPAAIAAVKGWHYGRYAAMRSERAREILTEFVPALLEALGDTGDPDLALATFDKFLSEVPAAVQLFSMLRANPRLLRLVAQIMGSAPRLASILGRRRRLLEAILDPGYAGARPSSEEIRALIRRQVFEAGSYEERLNLARISGQEQAFSIGVRLLSRELRPSEAGAAYSLLAEVLIQTLLEAVQEQYGGSFPPPAVIGMGKFGGREMTASSDLDLIVIYGTAPDSALHESQHYARITQRLISALSAPTSEGSLYPVDMRLRPSGKSGPVAVRLDGFLNYQEKEAWTWEHLALTRARPIAGPAALQSRLREQIRQVLTLPHDREKVASDVHEMRAMIQKEKGTSELWHTKNHEGGLVDAEFIVQFLQIVHAAREPAILSQNTVEAVQNLIKAGILNPAHGHGLTAAVQLYQDIAQVLRLCTEGRFHAAGAPRDLIELLLQVTGEPDISHLEARLAGSYEMVSQLFSEIVV